MAKSKSKAAARNSSQVKSGRGEKQGNRQSDLQHLERVFELMEKHEVAELEWERSGERLKLKTRYATPEQVLISASQLPAGQGSGAYRGGSEPGQWSSPAGLPTASGPVASVSGSPQASALNSNQKQILSPFVGTFYRAPTPEADPYVREGQGVKRGDVLCIIEAMKLMNEIEAEIPGKIISVLAENGQPVEFGEPLFVIEP